jgi:hypothetical protein
MFGGVSIIALVEIHPGFLPAEHVNQVTDPVNVNGDIAGHTSEGYPLYQCKAFEGARGRVISEYQRRRPEKIEQQFPHQLLHPGHPNSPGLVNENVSVPVDHKTGKAVRFAKDETTAFCSGVKELPKTCRLKQCQAKEFLIGLFARGANEAHCDKRCGIDIAGPEREALCSEHLDPASGLKIMDRIGYLVAEYPAMPTENAPLAPWMQG